MIRILGYCSEPKSASQIISFCALDLAQFNKVAEKCLTRYLLRKFNTGGEELRYVVSENWKTLETVREVMMARFIDGSINLFEISDSTSPRHPSE